MNTPLLHISKNDPSRSKYNATLMTGTQSISTWVSPHFWRKNTTQLIKCSNATQPQWIRPHHFVRRWWIYRRLLNYHQTTCTSLPQPGEQLVITSTTLKNVKNDIHANPRDVNDTTIISNWSYHHYYHFYCCIKSLFILLCPRVYPCTISRPLK